MLCAQPLTQTGAHSLWFLPTLLPFLPRCTHFFVPTDGLKPVHWQHGSNDHINLHQPDKSQCLIQTVPCG